MPVVGVNAAGVVGVMWYDRRDNQDNLGWWVRFSASTDGGETFSPSVKVSEAPFDQKNANKPLVLEMASRGGGNISVPFPSGGLHHQDLFLSYCFFSGGDTAGMAPDAAGAFHPFWIDNRTGTAQAWTATVEVNGVARRNGSPALEGLEDLSVKTELSWSHARFDQARGTVSADLYVRNTSNDELLPPLKLRVLSIASAMGDLQIMNADENGPRSGSIWDFSGLIVGSSLRPNEMTKTRTLTFKLSDARSLAPYDPRPWGTKFVSLDIRVLGHSQPAGAAQ